MEKQNSGLSIVLKVLVTLGALVLVVGLFLPDIKLEFQKLELSESVEELADTFGGKAELEKELKEESENIKEEINEGGEDDEDIEEFEEEYGFNIYELKGNFSYISDYSNADKAFGVKINIIKWIVLIVAIVLAVAAVVFAWFNVPVVSIITGFLSSAASLGFMIFLIVKKFTFNFTGLWDYGMKMIYKFKMNFGFFILIAGAVILLVSAIVLTVVINKAKKAVANTEFNGNVANNSFNNDNFVNNNFAGVQPGGLTDDQPTVPLVDVAPEPMHRESSVQNQNSINTGVLVLDGNMKGVKIPIEGGETLQVGKDPQMASLVIDKSFLSVSRLHCTISFSLQNNQYYVTDNSSNGTFKSDGTRFVKGKRTAVPRQTIIYLATDKCKIKLL